MVIEQIENLKKGEKVLILHDQSNDLSEKLSKYVEGKIETKPVVGGLKVQGYSKITPISSLHHLANTQFGYRVFFLADFPTEHYNLVVGLTTSLDIHEKLLDHLLNTLTFNAPLLILSSTPPADASVGRLKSELKFSGFIGVEVNVSFRLLPD